MNMSEKIWRFGPQAKTYPIATEVMELCNEGDIRTISTPGGMAWDLTMQGLEKFGRKDLRERVRVSPGKDTGRDDVADAWVHVLNKTAHTNQTLNERGANYGSFAGHAKVTQGLKRVMEDSARWDDLSVSQKESLEMVVHKIGRILNGNPNYVDSWRDIVGYAQLVVDELVTTEGASDARVVKQIVRGGKMVDA